MKTNSIIALGFAAVLSLGLSVAQAQTGHPTKSQKQFMTKAIQGDLAEIKVGELAQQKGKTKAVRIFGKTLQNDHSDNLSKAKMVAQSIGLKPPASASQKQKSEYESLSKLGGAAFDKKFAADMVKDHKKDISLFKKETKAPGAVGSYAQNSLPALRKHLSIAENLQKGGTTGSSK